MQNDVGEIKTADRLLLLGPLAGATTSLIAAIILFATFASLIHEASFYSVIGYSFLTLLTPSDYLKQSIYWIPFISFALALGFFEGSRKRKHFKLRRELAISSGDVDALMDLGFKSKGYIIAVSLVFVIIPLIIFSVVMPWPIIIFTCPMLLLMAILPKLESWLPAMPISILKWVVVSAGVAMVSAMLGYTEAALATRPDSHSQPTLIVTRLVPTGEDVILLRYIDKGIVGISRADNQVIFIPWSDVQKVATKIQVTQSLFDIITYIRK